MTKYKKYFDEMIAQNRELFIKFKITHDMYVADSKNKQLKKQFNEEGAKALEVIRNYESKLCNRSERGVFRTFSSGLADKFWEEVRLNYPRIDEVGIL